MAKQLVELSGVEVFFLGKKGNQPAERVAKVAAQQLAQREAAVIILGYDHELAVGTTEGFVVDKALSFQNTDVGRDGFVGWGGGGQLDQYVLHEGGAAAPEYLHHLLFGAGKLREGRIHPEDILRC